MDKAYRNQERMLLMIEQWEESGMSQDEFCRSEKIPKSTFYYWRKKYKEEKESLKNPFIPVTIKNDNKSLAVNTGITIDYPNGVRITITSQPTSDYIRKLINIF
jgi:hypothetical protein